MKSFAADHGPDTAVPAVHDVIRQRARAAARLWVAVAKRRCAHLPLLPKETTHHHHRCGPWPDGWSGFFLRRLPWQHSPVLRRLEVESEPTNVSTSPRPDSGLHLNPLRLLPPVYRVWIGRPSVRKQVRRHIRAWLAWWDRDLSIGTRPVSTTTTTTTNKMTVLDWHTLVQNAYDSRCSSETMQRLLLAAWTFLLQTGAAPSAFALLYHVF